MREEILRMDHVTFEDRGITYLDNFNLQVFKGEIMGLIPLDSLGMQELCLLLRKNVPISAGRIYFHEVVVNNYEHSSNEFNKIFIIEQRSKLIEKLSVSENIFVMRSGFKQKIIDRDILDIQGEMMMEELKFHLEIDKDVKKLTQLERCLIELVKGVLSGCTLIVLHEPASFLSLAELEKFYKIIDHYRNKGISFLYIGNHHKELFRVCSRVALMENGMIIKIFSGNELLDEKIKPYTISFETHTNMRELDHQDMLLEFKNVETENLSSMNFTIHRGECISLLDIQNSVLEEILGLMTGNIQEWGGEIQWEGKLYPYSERKNFLNNGIAMIDSSPIQKNLFMELSYLENLCFLVDQRKNGVSYERLKKSVLQEYREECKEDIEAGNIQNLSLASYYTLVYSKVHLYGPRLVFCLKPFANADMYLRKHILNLIQMLKRKGITVIILGVNLSDSLDVANRLLYAENGQITKEYAKEEFQYLKEESF